MISGFVSAVAVEAVMNNVGQEVIDWVERRRIADALRAYCARDTLGMVELRRASGEKSRGGGEEQTSSVTGPEMHEETSIDS